MPLKIVCCEHSSIQHDARNGFCRVCPCMNYDVEYVNDNVEGKDGTGCQAHSDSLTRPSWDEYFLGICQAVLVRADCLRAQHGAVIVRENRIVSTGYNGGPAGGPSCLAGECPRGQQSYEQLGGFEQGNHDYSNCISLHAEANAIAYANRHDTIGATIYIDAAPCDMCLKLIRAAGIVRVVYGLSGSYQSMEL